MLQSCLSRREFCVLDDSELHTALRASDLGGAFFCESHCVLLCEDVSDRLTIALVHLDTGRGVSPQGKEWVLGNGKAF